MIPNYNDLIKPINNTTIIIGYYPQIDINEFSSIPIILQTQIITNPITNIITITLPNELVGQKVYYQLNIPTTTTTSSPTPTTTIVTSPIFTILPTTCYNLPSSTSTTNDLSSPLLCQTKCNTNQQCLYSTSTQSLTCQTTTSLPIITNPDDPNQQPCSQCNISTSHWNDKQCNDKNECIYDNGWGGETCSTLTKCLELSSQQCTNSNGYLEPINNNNDCGNKCICYNYFIGDKCSQCSLQCYNNGIVYSKCNQCGCPRGYNGLQCQCQSEYGTLLLNRYSIILQQYYALLTKYKNQPLPPFSNELQEGYHMLYNIIQLTFEELLLLDRNSITLSLTIPNDNNNITSFNIIINYNCNEYNHNLSSDELKRRWNDILLTRFITHPVVKQYFTFDTNNIPTITIVNELQPTEPTLPPQPIDDDEPNNTFNHFSYINNIFILFFISTLFFFYQFF